MPRRPTSAASKSNVEIYRFRIDAWTPARIPMLRLAEYMHELATMLGQSEHVHFRRIAKGSTVIVHAVEHEAAPKVRERVTQLRRGEGPSEAQRAFASANKMLREDNAVGSLKAGAVILRFPGKNALQEEFTAVRQHGFFDGILTGVRGSDETAHITLVAESKTISGFYTSRSIAKELGKKFYEPVRLHGRGRWNRDSEGNWTLHDFKVDSFEALDDAPLTSAVADLRAIKTDWDDNAYRELQMIRHGPPKRNGGH